MLCAMFAYASSLFLCCSVVFFFFNDTATTEIYTLSLHDALPISGTRRPGRTGCGDKRRWPDERDRKSTRLNSSHANISYAVFCLEKKKNNTNTMNAERRHDKARKTQSSKRSV